jgi:hypothetical protein
VTQAVKFTLLAAGLVFSFYAQQPPSAETLRAESTSSVSVTKSGDEETVHISNVSYEVTGDAVAGRPRGQRLLLRKTTCSKQVLGEMGQEADVALEAWPLGVDLKHKPIYTVKVTGTGGQTVDDALFVADRGLEDTDWWSVYRLGTGRHLFDTYVPLVNFSISKEIVESRYVGLEVPPDDASDTRLKQKNVVAVVIYASQERVLREALLTADNPTQAAEMRQYEGTTRTVSLDDQRPPRVLQIAFRPDDDSTLARADVMIPLAGDDLDLAHAKLPPGLHLKPFKR